MRKMLKDGLRSENFLLRTSAVLFLLGFLLFNASEASAKFDPCDVSQYFAASSTIAPMKNENNELFGWGNFDILRGGELDFYTDVTFPTPLPANTDLRILLNGNEIGTMTRYISLGNERWYWGINELIATVHVGDVMAITKNGQPFLSGSFSRYVYNFAFVGGYVPDESSYCSYTQGYIYFPTSPFPRRLIVYPSVYTNSPVTRITVNEPNLSTGGIGAEIAEVPITTVGAPLPNGLRRTSARNLNIPLTGAQYQNLQQGLLTVNVFTESAPEGYSQMPLGVFYINSLGDFEGDGQADLAVFRPSEQTWYLLYSSNNLFQSVQFGLPTDKVVIGDYDHDGKTDITSFQVDNPDYPGLGVWQIRQSSNNSTTTIQWGLPGDIPLSMDIDGNNASDLVVFRPSSGTWYVRRMGDIIKPRNGNSQQNVSRFVIINWGMNGDKPLTADFDADGREEIGVFRPAEGNWYIYNCFDETYRIPHWGLNGDIPVAKDFDGDAKADIAVYRPSEGIWYILSSLDGSLIARQFGLGDDIPVPADFDKDGVSDIAVYRPSNGTWYVLRSSDNSFFSTQFGVNGDIPASSAVR